MIGGTQNVIISGCRVWDVIGDVDPNHGGINIFTRSDLGNENITVENCEIWDSDAGVVIKSTKQTNIVTKNNYLHDFVDEGIHDIGANSILDHNIIYNARQGIECVNNYDSAIAPNPTITYNTILNSVHGTNLADWHTSDDVRVESFKHNIIYSNELGGDYYALHDTTYGNLGAKFTYADYNMFYHPSTNNIIEYNPSGGVIDLNTYQTATGLEQNSQQVNPLFMTISNKDFRLSSGSPARTASSTGDYIGAINPDEQIGRIEIHPLQITLNQNDEYLFIVKIFDIYENEIPPGHFPVQWSADNAVIDQNGVYTKTTSLQDTVHVNVDGYIYDAIVFDSSSQSICGDTVCDLGETCSSCLADCPTGTGEVCCLGSIHTGNCCDDHDCISPEICVNYTCTTSTICGPADTNSDNIVSITELMSYIADWKSGSVTITDLMTGIGEWKNGCS